MFILTPLEHDYACVVLSHMFLVRCYARRWTCHRKALRVHVMIIPNVYRVCSSTSREELE
jgi:hypothetical protein